MISLRDALSVMACKGEDGSFLPFSLTLVTCNLREDTGGRRITYENAVLAGAPFGKKGSARSANHFINGTRNIYVPGKGRPITIHNICITEFNGERIYLS